MNEVAIIHRFPLAEMLTQRIGGNGIVVLHVLIRLSEERSGERIVSASLREVSDLLPTSKDTVARRIDQLQRVGVLRQIDHSDDPFAPRTFVLQLANHGIELAA